MNTNITGINLKVLVMDTDYYALQAVNGYLAWDRRTRVTCLAETPEEMWNHVLKTPLAELPDVILIAADHFGAPADLERAITRLRERIKDVAIICLATALNLPMIEAAAHAGARGYLLKGEVRSQIAWAIVYALNHDFIISQSIAHANADTPFSDTRLFHAAALPRRREYPELTERIRQAIELCVVKGMPAHLAADEMGISLHTIRSYIKEGYRILEAYDETEYPVDMTPQERAFMRLTKFTDEE